VCQRSRPYLGTKVARHADEGACKNQTLCDILVSVHAALSGRQTGRAIEVTKVQRVCVVCLPS
jgi:hypothetical protein